jgi:hypothetical protein
MAIFDRALLIAHLSEAGVAESAETVWIYTTGQTERATERDLERLVAEGVLVRTAQGHGWAPPIEKKG